MTLSALHQFFTLYTWFGMALLILLIALVARFYERFSQISTHYRWYAIPVALMGAFAVRDASMPLLQGDVISEALLAIGGVLFLVMVVHLSRHMLRKVEG